MNMFNIFWWYTKLYKLVIEYAIIYANVVLNVSQLPPHTRKTLSQRLHVITFFYIDLSMSCITAIELSVRYKSSTALIMQNKINITVR